VARTLALMMLRSDWQPRCIDVISRNSILPLTCFTVESDAVVFGRLIFMPVGGCMRGAGGEEPGRTPSSSCSCVSFSVQFAPIAHTAPLQFQPHTPSFGDDEFDIGSLGLMGGPVAEQQHAGVMYNNPGVLAGSDGSIYGSSHSAMHHSYIQHPMMTQPSQQDNSYTLQTLGPAPMNTTRYSSPTARRNAPLHTRMSAD
jgi:hypothetical protein